MSQFLVMLNHSHAKNSLSSRRLEPSASEDRIGVARVGFVSVFAYKFLKGWGH